MGDESTVESVNEDLGAAAVAEAALFTAGVHSLGYGHYVEAAT